MSLDSQMQRLRFVLVQFLRSPYSPSPKGDAVRERASYGRRWQRHRFCI
ncbi:hypothetical protein [uncultured Nostoc sp.]